MEIYTCAHPERAEAEAEAEYEAGRAVTMCPMWRAILILGLAELGLAAGLYGWILARELGA